MKNSFAKPLIIPAGSRPKLNRLFASHPEITLIDTYSHQLRELFQVSYPKQKPDSSAFRHYLLKHFGSDPEKTGNWVYYPWNNTCVHLLEENLFQTVRTARNVPLIPKSLQQKFSRLVVGIVGLSVGSSVALTLVQSGGANTLKLADFDQLSLSNLNRMKASTLHLGLNKTHLIARQIYEINPYANLILFPDGLKPANLVNFFHQSPKLDLVVDEADDLATKDLLRQSARAAGIPLVMATDNGFVANSATLRFDRLAKTSDRSLVRKRLTDLSRRFDRIPPQPLSDRQKFQKIVALVGKKHISPEMQLGSLWKLNGRIAGWPQLAITAFLGGSLAATLILLLAANRNTPVHQTSFSLLKHLNPDYHTPKAQKKRRQIAQKFQKLLQTLNTR